jgi:membrane protease YdiL (CAAX protease family)
MKHTSFLQRYPIIPFVILVFLLPLPILLLLFVNLPLEPILIYASWTPNIAAFLVLGLILREKGGIKRLISGWGKWRVGLKWYLISLSPLFIAFLAAGVYIVLGGKPSSPVRPLGFTLLISFILSIVTGATGEELGWRGFLLPRLQEKFNALISTLIVGVIWALWHLPLWTLEGQVWEAVPYWAFALGAISSSVIFTFVLNNTGGSLLMASLIHFAMNFGLNAVGILGWIPTPRGMWMIASILYTFTAIIIIVVSGPTLITKSQRVTE